MSARKTPKSTINVITATPAWTRSLRTATAVCRRAANAALTTAGPRRAVDVSILLTNDSALRKLNAVFRGKDKPTNVLSFPAESDDGRPPGAKGQPRALGDIAIALGVLTREAKAEGKTLTAHLSHLVVHGVLHLLGYDHERDEDALTMERLEKRILARLGISDPYAIAPVKRPMSKIK